MARSGDIVRFWLPAAALVAFAAYSGQKLIRAHIDPEVAAPNYTIEYNIPPRRGSVFSAYGKDSPFVRSVPYWEYRLDPVALETVKVKRRGEPQRPKLAIIKSISVALGLDFDKLKKMALNTKNRYQFLALSADPDAHATLADSSFIAGVAITDRQVRQYLHRRTLSHVLGSLNAEQVGSAGLELKYDKIMSGTPGTVRGMKDAHGRELYDKRKISIDPKPGADIYLTIEPSVQIETERALKWGIAKFGAGSGWAIVMDAKTAAIYAMASFPDFDPADYGKTTDSQKLNRAIGVTYEPGSVMKVITTAAAIDSNPHRFGPNTRYNTNRSDPNYYRLPGDVGHVWDPTMTLTDAIVHSSNIVIGKLAYDIGPKTLFAYQRKFGFGQKSGIELPGEEYGILPNPNRRMWDKASWSRAGIGQFVAVTAIQLASAYQAIANDGMRMKPHVISKIVAPNGEILEEHRPTEAGRAVRPETARTLRTMMLGVAAKGGTARRAALKGYSVAGKTGTAQKPIPGGRGYLPGQFRGSFCGIVPASDPKLVILVTLDFEHRNYPYHQGGVSAGPVFKRIALAAIRYLGIQPDRADELDDEEEDEYDKLLDERAGGR